MPDLDSFPEMVDRLKEVPDQNLAAVSLDVLSQPVDWVGLVRNHLGSLSDATFVERTRRILVEGVEPKAFLLHDEPNRFSIVLNHFDRESFACHREEGRITPHFHRCDFATRMLAGSYHHLLFDNGGELTQPQLSLWHQTRDDVDHVYFLPWQEYHCVLSPAQNTMSLQVRGPVRFRHSREGAALTDMDLLHARDIAMTALESSGGTSPVRGHVPDFAHRWTAPVDALPPTSTAS